MHAQEPESISPLVGFVGKLPAQADFIRQHVADRVGGEFDRWLVKSTQAVLSSKVELPAHPVRFVYSAPQCDSVLVGVLVASRDQVGRSFPLAIYSTLAAPVAARNTHALPLAYDPFLDEAEAIGAAASGCSAAELRARIAALQPPGQDVVLAAARQCRDVLTHTPASDMFERTFARALPDSHWYGVHTLLVAAEGARATPAAAPTVVDCPITSDVDLAAWIDLSRRCASPSLNCLSIAWVQPDPRLLVVLGHAPEQLLQFVSDPRSKSARLWPLTTERVDAISRARDTVTAQAGGVQAALHANIDALWTLLAKS